MSNPSRIAGLRSAPLLALATLATLTVSRAADAQTTTTGSVLVRVIADSLPVSGATVAAAGSNSESDRSGLALLKVPTGRRTLHVTSAGFLPESLAVNVAAGMTRVTIAMHHRAASASAASASQDKVAAQGKTTAQENVAPRGNIAPADRVVPAERAVPRESLATQTQVAPQASDAPQTKVALPN